jgi:hypothetical protein
MMLKKYLNKIRPALSIDQLSAFSDAAIKNIVEEKDPSMSQLRIGMEKANEAWSGYKGEWEEYLFGHLNYLTEAKNRAEQILLLREITVNALERSANTIKYFARDEDERKILAEVLEKDKHFEEFEPQQAIVRLNNEVSCYCFRSISLILGDVKHNDWFDVYGHLYSHQIEMLYNSIIADRKGEDYSPSIMLAAIKDSVDNYKSRILKGEDFSLTDTEMAKVKNGFKAP